MNNISSIAIRELKSNKKTTSIMIISIIVVTILINSIATLALSYQDYIVNLSRNKENWEIFFDNIEYDNVKYIENDKNVRQISVVQDIGVSDNSYSKGFTELIHIKAYDNNALENLSINLKKGRLPQASNEIVINEDMRFEIGDNITATIGNSEFTYTIVGEIENTDFDEFDYVGQIAINGAITLFDKINISDSTILSVSVINKNISDVYNTATRIENEIRSKNPNANISIRYNEELLSFACIAKEGSEFQTSIIIVIRFIGRNYSYIINSINIYDF